MKIKLLKMMSLALLIMASSSVSFAGGDSHGGKWTEGDLKHFLVRLIPYLQSSEGRDLFPEIVAYDKTNPKETFEMILNKLNPRLVDGPVYDSEGNERDCVSGKDTIRYFKCNSQSLPPKPDSDAKEQLKSEYYGSLYRLVLHEGFVQVGLEAPRTKEVPSEYQLSSRLSVHLENFPEWLPGKEKDDIDSLNLKGTSIKCVLDFYGTVDPYPQVEGVLGNVSGHLDFKNIYANKMDDPKISRPSSDSRTRITVSIWMAPLQNWISETNSVDVTVIPSNEIVNYFTKKGQLYELIGEDSLLRQAMTFSAKLENFTNGIFTDIIVPQLNTSGQLYYEKHNLECSANIVKSK